MKSISDGLKGLGQQMKVNLSSATSAIASRLNESSAALIDDDSEHYGPLWEANETVEKCRGCKLAFLAPLRTKHHCRYCASVFCNECVPGSAVESSSITRAAAKACENTSEDVKVCHGCLRGETPGDEIIAICRAALEAANKKLIKRPNALAEARERAAIKGSSGAAAHDIKRKTAEAIPKQKSNLEKLATTVGDHLGILERSEAGGPSVQIALTRGAIFRAGLGTAPIKGYFEINNKSREVVCIKLLVKGGNPVFETPRPSYMAIPPAGCASAMFEHDHLEIIVLHSNPFPPAPSMVFDTTEKMGWTGTSTSADRISPSAQVAKFGKFRIFKANAPQANCLLKYKGNGVLECRRGDSLGRIGLIAKLTGKRHVAGEIDYDTNISALFDITP